MLMSPDKFNYLKHGTSQFFAHPTAKPTVADERLSDAVSREKGKIKYEIKDKVNSKSGLNFDFV